MSKTIIKRLNIIPAKCPAEMIEMLKGQSLKLEILMATVEELSGRINGVIGKLNKAKEEIVGQVAALRASLDNAGTLPAEANVALANLESIAQALDDLNPDPVPAAEPATV